jgi:hypothetical protein
MDMNEENWKINISGWKNKLHDLNSFACNEAKLTYTLKEPFFLQVWSFPQKEQHYEQFIYSLIYSHILTNFMELSPSWEIASCAATQ